MRSKTTIIIIVLLILLIAAGGAYWYFMFGKADSPITVLPGNQTNGGGFVPIDRPTPSTSETPQIGEETSSPTPTPGSAAPVLRQLSKTPVGGYGILTASNARNTAVGSTTVRWVDTGRGNTYETQLDKTDVTTLSNTLVPRIYQTWWNKDLSTFFAQYTSANSDNVTTVLTKILRGSATATSSDSKQQITTTPYQLKGTLVDGNVIGVAVSPEKDRAIVIVKENNRAIGYISKFDGTGGSQLFSLPLVQINVDWPETNTIAVTTKASAFSAGYLYSINPKTGAVKQILGGVPGLAAKVSRDATRVLFSSGNRNSSDIKTAVLDQKTGVITEVLFKTLAEKCVWSSRVYENVYCGVPTNIGDGVYPDDWYLSYNQFRDSIWVLDTKTGNANQIANLLTLGNTLIDTFNLQLEQNDGYLLFMNKNDLSLWSLDLVASR